jgi:hypothetical protein
VFLHDNSRDYQWFGCDQAASAIQHIEKIQCMRRRYKYNDIFIDPHPSSDIIPGLSKTLLDKRTIPAAFHQASTEMPSTTYADCLNPIAAYPCEPG